MIIISSKEFRDKQKSYLDKVDEGMEILIHRGKNKSYRIVPVTEDDTLVSDNFIMQPDEDLARAITAEELVKGVKEDLREMFKKGKK